MNNKCKFVFVGIRTIYVDRTEIISSRIITSMANNSDIFFARHIFNRGRQQCSYHYSPSPNIISTGEYLTYPIYILYQNSSVLLCLFSYCGIESFWAWMVLLEITGRGSLFAFLPFRSPQLSRTLFFPHPSSRILTTYLPSTPIFNLQISGTANPDPFQL